MEGSTFAFSATILTIAVIALAIICIVLIICLVVTNKKVKEQRARLDTFMIGDITKDLETLILDRFGRIKDLEEDVDAAFGDINTINGKLLTTFSKMAIVKYDAYAENGGKVSFALTLLNGENDGFVLNVMNSRDGSYCYIKEIKKGSCDTQMGLEEQKSLAKAITQGR